MQYNAIGEVDVTPTAQRAANWHARLEAGYQAAVGRTDDGRAEVIITFEADAFDVAAATGLLVLGRVLGQLRAYSVMSTAEYDRRTDALDPDGMVSTVQAATILGVSRQRVLELIDNGALAATKVGRGWALSEAAVIARRDALIEAARNEVAHAKR